MRFHTYTKFSPEMADAVDLQALLDKLADFLLQSGFAGGAAVSPVLGRDRRGGRQVARRAQAGDPRRAHRERPVHAGDARGAPRRRRRDVRGEARRAARRHRPAPHRRRLPQPREAAADARRPPGGHRPGRARPGGRHATCSSTSPTRASTSSATRRSGASSARSASRASAATTRRTSPPASRPTAWSKPYEFGDVLNLDVNETLKNALVAQRHRSTCRSTSTTPT